MQNTKKAVNRTETEVQEMEWEATLNDFPLTGSRNVASVESANDRAASLIKSARLGRFSTIDRVMALSKDILALSNDECEGDVNEAHVILLQRIGGIINLRSYTDCLLAKSNRKS